MFFGQWVSGVFSRPAIPHIYGLFSWWLISLSHVGVAHLLEFHGWFFLQTLTHTSHTFVHLHLTTFWIVVRGNIGIIRIPISSLSENRIFCIDLWCILSIHLCIINELLAWIANTTSHANCYFLWTLAYVFLVNCQFLTGQGLRTSRMLLNKFECVWLILIVEHYEFVRVRLVIDFVYSLL